MKRRGGVANVRQPQGRFARNLHGFCLSLRAAGVPVGPQRVADALDAVSRVGVQRPDDLRAALRAVLVSDPAHFTLFEQLFHLYFRRAALLGGLGGLPGTPPAPGAAVSRRVFEAAPGSGGERERESRRGRDAAGTASDREAFFRKDFEQMDLEEQARLKALLQGADFPWPTIRTRRRLPHRRGERLDLRRTLAGMPRTGGELVRFARQRRRRRAADLVLLCDISGSMSRYARAFLLFAHALARRRPGVRVFVFGTRLTPIGRYLRIPDPDRALARTAAEVRDFDGGTRITACLRRFNRDWARRVLACGGTVVLLTDGLERDPDNDPGVETARLRRACRRLLWLNPMLRYDAFEPRARGIRRMLPHVDRLLPAHNVESLLGLGRALCGGGFRGRAGREAA